MSISWTTSYNCDLPYKPIHVLEHLCNSFQKPSVSFYQFFWFPVIFWDGCDGISIQDCFNLSKHHPSESLVFTAVKTWPFWLIVSGFSTRLPSELICHSMFLCWNSVGSLFWQKLWIFRLSSAYTATKLVPVSDAITFTELLRTTNPCITLMQLSVSMENTICRWTARMDQHVNMTPYRLITDLPLLIAIGANTSIPSLINGDPSGHTWSMD